MSADLLREAASKMRERAEIAKPGPWAYLCSTGRTEVGEIVTYASADFESSVTVECGPDGGAMFDCEHFTSWHPAVALAVANWLDATVRRYEFGWELGETPEIDPIALAVARAYLGSDR